MSSGCKAFPRLELVRSTIRTIILFVVLGPPIGALVWFFGGVFLLNAGIFNLMAIPLSYYFGVVAAAAAGILISIWGVLRGKPPVILASVVGILIFVASSIGVKTIGDGWAFHLVRFLSYMVPAWICWSIAQIFWEEKS